MRSRARTVEDENKAYRKGYNKGVKESIDIVLMVCLLYLGDKLNWGTDGLRAFMKFVMHYMNEISSGGLSKADLVEALKEYDIEVG